MASIDFLPDDIRTRRARRKRLTRQGYLLAVCVLTAGALMLVWQGRIRKARAELTSELSMLDNRAEDIRRRLAMRSELETQLADLMIKKRINEHLGARAGALDVMTELERVLPLSMALLDANLETMELRLPVRPADPARASGSASAGAGSRQQFRIVKRVRLTITGVAPTDVDVANFIAQLSASPLFEEVKMGYAKKTEFRGRSAREFRASCYVVR